MGKSFCVCVCVCVCVIIIIKNMVRIFKNGGKRERERGKRKEKNHFIAKVFSNILGIVSQKGVVESP